jgi:hypothetical protein
VVSLEHKGATFEQEGEVIDGKYGSLELKQERRVIFLVWQQSARGESDDSASAIGLILEKGRTHARDVRLLGGAGGRVHKEVQLPMALRVRKYGA